MPDLNQIVTLSYVTIQVLTALYVSVTGAIHVRRCLSQRESSAPKTLPDDEQKPKENSPLADPETSIEKETEPPQMSAEATTDEQKESGDNRGAPSNVPSNADTTITMDIQKDKEDLKQKGFIVLWLKIIWKMRSVYSSLAVHCFDVLTDVLVIMQWMNTPNEPNDHIDPQAMAYSAIAVIVFSRVLSAIAIYIKERDFIRSLLQLFDLLIFQEIYESHHKIVTQLKNKQLRDKHHPIESTLSFKYVRNMEAIFESIPEAVLQLVYVMRVGFSKVGNDQIIFIVSIVQSIISMTNSILNNDYTMMKEDKWDKYKKRFPPSFEFVKHATCRISEIIYRIGLLALFWTVCEGMAFAILIGVELLFIVLRVSLLLYGDELIFDADTILLAISSVIVIPSEEVYGVLAYEWHEVLGSVLDKDEGVLYNGGLCCFIVFLSLCWCMGPASALASLSLLCSDGGAEISFPPVIRIGTSLYEIIFILIWAFVNGSRTPFLMKPEHGFVVFIVTCVCFVIFSQYRILFPDFALPRNVNVRSKWGYAYSNELTELQKIKVPLKRMPYIIKRKSREQTKVDVVFSIECEGDFWDEPYTVYGGAAKPITAAMFALVKGNDDIVQWLESRGSVAHKDLDLNEVVALITS
eukprot:232281_1